MRTVAAIVYQKRFERLEEQAGGIADAGGGFALVAHDPAQFLQQQFVQSEIGTVCVRAAQQAAFELVNQQQTCLWRELAQELPQPFNRVGARHWRLYPRLNLSV